MALRRRPDEAPVGLGLPDVSYDQSGGQVMPGMELPQPGGNVKKVSMEFDDPMAQQAAAQQGPPPGAGVPPAGMEQPPIMPAGAQSPQDASVQATPMLAGLGQQGAFNSSMLSDADLAAMVQDSGGEEMSNIAMDPTNPQASAIQEALMMAARRRLGY